MTRRIVRGLGLALCWLVAPRAGAQADAAADSARPIALAEAVRLAQRRSPLTVQARGTERNARAGIRSAYSAFLPNLSLTADNTHRGGDFVGQDGNITAFTGPTSYSTALSAGLELFDGGRRLFALRQARFEAGAAAANDVSQRFRVALEVKQQYFNVLAARESRGAALAQLEQARQQFRSATARVAAGAATKSDSLRSVILVGNARLALVTADNNLRVANAALTRLVASPYPVTAAVGDSAESSTIELDSLALDALALRGPAVAQAEANVAAASAAVRVAKTPYLPTIAARYSRGGSGFDSRYGLGDTRYVYSDALTFSLSYPLFNQYTREAQVVRASVAEDNADAVLRDARLLARQTLTQYVGAVRSASERIEIQTASVTAAEEDLRVQQQRYALGASTLLDVLTSQSQLDGARAALITARYDLRVAKAQIEALVGRDL